MTYAPQPDQLLAAMEGPAILITPDFRIEAANDAYIERHCRGTSPVGRYCYEISHHSNVPCAEIGESCPVQRALTTREPARVLHVHETAEGEEYVDVEAHPLLDEQGEVQYLIETVKVTRTSSPIADGEHQLLGRSPAFIHMLEMVQRVGPSETAALLLGESGTGKELVARAIHAESSRREKAFVVVECSGLTESLFESELFGHEKGAFTGASARKIGLVETAEGGTLFLDEIGDIPLPLQVKLLRLLETRSYKPVGSAVPRQADFRLVCATHRNLDDLVEKGLFRRDLYYRISAFPIYLPSLEERLDDLPLLAKALLYRLCPEKPKRLAHDALQWLRQQTYPGNIRELRNMLERACLLADGETIWLHHLTSSASHETTELFPGLQSEDEIITLEEAENRYLKQVIRLHRGDRQSLADKLGVSERTLFRKINKIDS